MKEDLLSFCKQLQLTEVGIVPLPLPSVSLQILTEDNPCPFTVGTADLRISGDTKLVSPKSAITILFPYYVPYKSTGKTQSRPNISRYTWAADYHLIIPNYLQSIIDYLKSQPAGADAEYEIHSDTSALPDRYMAYLAGLGFYGENHCFINPTYGSYTFIGTILTSLEIPGDSPRTEHCLRCHRCRQTCPGQALQEKTFTEESSFYYDRCKSYITQKKGDLTENEMTILRKTPLIFGCDVCQEVCPHNQDIPVTPLPEFRHISPYLNIDDLDSMTNKEFKLVHGKRAYAWRGKALLLRNKRIISSNFP